MISFCMIMLGVMALLAVYVIGCSLIGFFVDWLSDKTAERRARLERLKRDI